MGPGNPDSSARFVESSSQLSGCGQSRPDSASQMEDHFLRSGPVPTLLYCLPLGCLHLVFILKTETFTMGVRVSEFRPSWSPEHWMPGLAGGEAPCPSPPGTLPWDCSGRHHGCFPSVCSVLHPGIRLLTQCTCLLSPYFAQRTLYCRGTRKTQGGEEANVLH